MKKRIKFTAAKLANLKHPIGKQPEKWYDLTCDGLAVFVMPQPSLTKVYYVPWSVVTYGADGKQRRSGRYKKLDINYRIKYLKLHDMIFNKK